MIIAQNRCPVNWYKEKLQRRDACFILPTFWGTILPRQAERLKQIQPPVKSSPWTPVVETGRIDMNSRHRNRLPLGLKIIIGVLLLSTIGGISEIFVPEPGDYFGPALITMSIINTLLALGLIFRLRAAYYIFIFFIVADSIALAALFILLIFSRDY